MPELIVVVCNFANEPNKALFCYGTLKLTPLVIITNSNIVPPCHEQKASSLRRDLVTERRTDRHDEDESLFSSSFQTGHNTT
jgi:hypothetical protein